MYQVINCDNQFYCLFDTYLTVPTLLGARYLESELLPKALKTQKSELDSLKLFYDFWLEKFGETLDYSLYKSGFANVQSVAYELDAFWDYMLAGKQIANVVMLPSTRGVAEINKRKRTAAKRCMDIVRFIVFLSDTYLTLRYQNDSSKSLIREQKFIAAQLSERRAKYQKFASTSKEPLSSDILRSLTSEQFRDLIEVFSPNKAAPNQGCTPTTFTVLETNSLNPIISFEIQMRNYLLTTLLVQFGLRVGEALLLHKESFLPYLSDKTRMLMRVRNLEDEYEDIEDLRANKPSIKTAGSVRELDIPVKFYKQLMLYYNLMRPRDCEHEYIFAAHKSPYKPLSYSTYLTEFKKYMSEFKAQFPKHFEPEYAESIEGEVTPHWLRHTWAYSTLTVFYDELKLEYMSSGVVDIKGLMEDAKERLRVLGGWSEKSRMPSKYAKRFIQEEANRALLNVFYGDQNSILLQQLEEEDWDAAFGG